MGNVNALTREDEDLTEETAFEEYGHQLALSCLYPNMKGGRKYLTFLQYFIYATLSAFNAITLVVTVLLTLKEKNLIIIIQSIHYLLLNTIAFTVLFSYNIYRPEFARIHRIVRLGCYTYDQPTQITMESFKIDLKKKKKIVYAFISLYICVSGMVIIIFGPLADYLLGKFDQDVYTKNGVSLNLPIPSWSPFGTDTPITLILTIILQFGSHGINVLIFNVVLVSLFVLSQQLNYEMHLLIQSIKRLPERCVQHYRIKFKEHISILQDYMINDGRLSWCYYYCLKENIIHHHKILLLYRDVSTVLTFYYCVVSYAGSIIMAISGVLIIFGNGQLSTLAPAISLLIAEILVLFSMAWCGEVIKGSNENLRMTLYNTNWYCTNKKLCKILDIMMISTEKPLILYFNVYTKHPATIETFTAVIHTAYSYFNLLFAFKGD